LGPPMRGRHTSSTRIARRKDTSLERPHHSFLRGPWREDLERRGQSSSTTRMAQGEGMSNGAGHRPFYAAMAARAVLLLNCVSSAPPVSLPLCPVLLRVQQIHACRCIGWRGLDGRNLPWTEVSGVEALRPRRTHAAACSTPRHRQYQHLSNGRFSISIVHASFLLSTRSHVS
jgi:hypothetical protein